MILVKFNNDVMEGILKLEETGNKEIDGFVTRALKGLVRDLNEDMSKLYNIYSISNGDRDIFLNLLLEFAGMKKAHSGYRDLYKKERTGELIESIKNGGK